MNDLMEPEEVAKEIVNDLENNIPKMSQSLAVISNGNVSQRQKELNEIEANARYIAQQAGITAYNMHLAMTTSSDNQLPINSVDDLQNEEKIIKLAKWLNRNHPNWPK